MPDVKKFELSPSLAILVSGIFIAGAIVFVNLRPAQTVVANPEQLPSANVPAAQAGEHIFGSPAAPIKLIEYSDFQCPYCKIVYPTLRRIVEESQGQVAWIHRSFPLESIHPQAKPAALASECIAEELGNDAFWKFADAIYNNQSKMSSEYYAQLALQLGANSAIFASCVSTEKYADKIDTEALDAQKNGGEGTPFTVVAGNGLQVPVSGALPYAQFVSVINAVKARQ
ncbi:MAG: DSBA oxidoreductase [Parcubacteria group bacterium Gr01-1014_56]|nr:MAG: DSBA oxidoreductase [Parcubacteria group bacterium Gr01-1014_56]